MSTTTYHTLYPQKRTWTHVCEADMQWMNTSSKDLFQYRIDLAPPHFLNRVPMHYESDISPAHFLNLVS
eukprot:5181457-Amphidinium_carterae.2